MQLSSVISKVKKAGWIVIELEGRFTARKSNNLYTIEWSRNGGVTSTEATCLKVRKLTDEDHMQSDYHAGSYADSIKQALDWADRWHVSSVSDAKLMDAHKATHGL